MAPAEVASCLEFLEILGIDRCSQPEAHEHRALTRSWALEALHERAARLRIEAHSAGVVSGTAPPSSDASRTLRAGTTVEMACL